MKQPNRARTLRMCPTSLVLSLIIWVGTLAGLSDSSTALEIAKKQAVIQQYHRNLHRQAVADGHVFLQPPHAGGLPPSHHLKPPFAGETTSVYSSVSPYYYPTSPPGYGTRIRSCTIAPHWTHAQPLR
jgi:hypothetical protein